MGAVLLCAAQASDAQSPPSRNAGALQIQPNANGANQQRVRVEQFTVQGLSLLREGDVLEALKPHLGERSLAELDEAAATVQRLYRDAGYGGVLAFLPEQNLSNGKLEIRVVEGKLESVDIKGASSFSADTTRAALSALVPGETPRLRVIDTQLQMLNENPARQVRVLLQPGLQAAGIAAKVEVQEADLMRWTARVDNSGSGASGRERLAVGWQHANVSGADHVLGVELQTAPSKPSSLAVASANYRIPLYSLTSMMDVYGAWSKVDGGSNTTVVGDVSFSGEGRIAGTRWHLLLPRSGEVDHRVIFGLEYRDYLNNCSIAGLPAGACGAGGASATVQPLSASYLAQRMSADGTQWAVQVSLIGNLAFVGAHADAASLEAQRAGAPKHYSLLRLTGSASHALAGDWRISARATGQGGGHALIPGEQLGLGGAAGVRGFHEQEVRGDQGLTISLELTTPKLAAVQEQLPGLELRASAFADAGWAKNQGDLACKGARSECVLASAGVGLRLGSRWTNAKLDYAHTLNAGTTTPKGRGTAHFSLTQSF